jgi:hypothetical protein
MVGPDSANVCSVGVNSTQVVCDCCMHGSADPHACCVLCACTADQAKVEALMKSITEIGLQEPVRAGRKSESNCGGRLCSTDHMSMQLTPTGWQSTVHQVHTCLVLSVCPADRCAAG